MRKLEFWLLEQLANYISWRNYGMVVGVDVGYPGAAITCSRPTVFRDMQVYSPHDSDEHTGDDRRSADDWEAVDSGGAAPPIYVRRDK